MDLQQLQQRNRQLAILNAIAQHLNREVELSKALNTALQQSVELLDLQTGWIWLTNPSTQTAYVAASYQMPPVFQQRPELLNGDCYCIQKYLSDKLDSTTNISEITCTRLKDLTEGTKGLRFHASVPLISGNVKVGIMNVLSADSQELSEGKLQLLHTIGDMLGIAIQRARLFENSRQLGIVQERNRMAREIHDTLAQSLSAISLKMETIQAFLESNKTDRLPPLVDQTLALAKSGLEEARRSVLDLRATPLQEYSLPEALEQLITQAHQSSSSTGEFRMLGTYQKLETRVAFGLYRIAQEAIRNILRHAECQNFSLEIAYQEAQILMTIKDDGKGFEESIQHNGFGLIGMTERTHLLKGSIQIQSQRYQGTCLRLTIPIDS